MRLGRDVIYKQGNGWALPSRPALSAAPEPGLRPVSAIRLQSLTLGAAATYPDKTPRSDERRIVRCRGPLCAEPISGEMPPSASAAISGRQRRVRREEGAWARTRPTFFRRSFLGDAGSRVSRDGAKRRGLVVRCCAGRTSSLGEMAGFFAGPCRGVSVMLIDGRQLSPSSLSSGAATPPLLA
jgi:hypothetical protein